MMRVANLIRRDGTRSQTVVNGESAPATLEFNEVTYELFGDCEGGEFVYVERSVDRAGF